MRKKILLAMLLIMAAFSVVIFADDDHSDFVDDPHDDYDDDAYYGDDRNGDNPFDDDVSEAIERYAEAQAALETAIASNNEAAIAAAERIMGDANVALVEACVKQSKQTGEKISAIYESAKNYVKEYGTNVAEHIPRTAGDPVILATGQYVLNENDLSVRSGLLTFSVMRTYISGSSGTRTVYAGDGFGSFWKTGLDMRIVRGASLSFEAALAAQQAVVLQQEGFLAQIQGYAAEDANCASILEEMELLLAESRAKLQGISQTVEKARRLGSLNAYSADGIDASLVNSGNNTLIFIGADGSPVMYDYQGNGIWLASSDSGYAHERIQSLDARDAESTAGFVRYAKNGTREYFDSWGRIQKLVDRADNVTLFSHNGKLLEKVTTAEGVEIAFVYAGGKIVSATASTGERVRYEYANGLLAAVIDDEGDTIRYQYDAGGYLTRIIKPDSSSIRVEYGFVNPNGNKMVSATINEEDFRETFVYSLANRITTHTDHAGVQTRYTYDVKGNTTRIESAQKTVVYQYNTRGLVTRKTDDASTENYSYDNRNNIILASYSDGSIESWQYNALDLVTRYVDRDGVVMVYAYDAKGNRTASERGGMRTETVSYDSAGKKSHAIDKNGRVTFYEYDNQSRLSCVFEPFSDSRREAALREAVEAGLHFGEHAGLGENKMLSAEENSRLNGLLQTVGATQAQRPLVMQHVLKEMYSYDANGNRAAKATGFGVILYSYDAEDRLVYAGTDSDQGIHYVYDALGNMIQKKNLYNTLDIVYKGFNRMAYAKMITKTGALSFNNLNTQSETRYAYDAFGRRTLAQDDSQAAVRTLYDGLTFDVIAERQALASGSFARGAGVWGDGNSEAGRYRFIVDEGGADSRTRHIGSERASGGRYTGVRTMLYANGRAVALSLSGADEQTGRAYFGTDTIGSVKSVTGESGKLETFYEYDSFGAPTNGDFSGGLDIAYAGKQLDASTKLYNYGYRDYAPAEGRFTTVDPIRDGLNWFVYTHNDPVNYVDLWGLAGDYGPDINGQPVVAHPGRNIKAEASITVYRNPDQGFYNDTIALKIGNQTMSVASVQSEANLSPEKNERI